MTSLAPVERTGAGADKRGVGSTTWNGFDGNAGTCAITGSACVVAITKAATTPRLVTEAAITLRFNDEAAITPRFTMLSMPSSSGSVAMGGFYAGAREGHATIAAPCAAHPSSDCSSPSTC